ncbi:type II toxin-antitoxin system VapC family toxin [Infirmifilum sp. SLHALR2]
MRKSIYLFDASSIVRALKEAKLVPLGGQALQWLTVYEVINVLWKESHLLRRLEASEADFLLHIFTRLVKEMVVLEPTGLEQDILRMAFSKGITAYDASYVALAARYGLTLVTEDRKLSRAASGVVSVASLDNLA